VINKLRWDALFAKDNFYDIPDSRKGPEDVSKHLLGFRARSPRLRESDEAKKLVQDEFEELARTVKVALYSAYTNPLTGLPTLDSHGYGMTIKRWGAKMIKIYIGIEMSQPLLRKDLNDAETYVTRLHSNRSG